MDENSKIEYCPYCRSKRPFRKNREDKWHCIECGQGGSFEQKTQEGYVPPFLRNLPYNEASVPVPNNRKYPINNKKKGIINKRVLEHQEDVNNSADALGLEE